MKFQFKCRVCGKCCKIYKIIINIGDALKLFDALNVKFNETFVLADKTEIAGSDKEFIYDPFIIKNKEYFLTVKNDPVNGCVFQKDNKCSIQDIKPSVCYFYPLNFNFESKSFSVVKYDICSGIYDSDYSEWVSVTEKFEEYKLNCQWHNEIAAFWNQYYAATADMKDFIIFFYESLYPIYLKRVKF
ncbi:MAG TPA: YkgJ family cysteine cluster protein [bacterium]|nr:YkgJ family cysteine cluster protein [bacterium]